MKKFICTGNSLANFLKSRNCNFIEEIKENGLTQYVFEYNKELEIAIKNYEDLRKKSLF